MFIFAVIFALQGYSTVLINKFMNITISLSREYLGWKADIEGSDFEPKLKKSVMIRALEKKQPHRAKSGLVGMKGHLKTY